MSGLVQGLVWNADMKSLGLRSPHKAVLARLADFANEEGENAFPSIARLASDTMLGERTVQSVLRDMEGLGLVARVKAGGNGPGSTARYHIDVERLESLRRRPEKRVQEPHPSPEPRVQDAADKGAGDCKKGCSTRTQSVSDPSTDPPPCAQARDADPLKSWIDAWIERFPKTRRGNKARIEVKLRKVIRDKAATMDELDAALARYLAAGYGSSQFAKGAESWLNLRYWTWESFPPPGDAPSRTGGRTDASNVVALGMAGARADAALVERVERWIKGQAWGEGARPDQNPAMLPDREWTRLAEAIKRRGAECDAMEQLDRWETARAWVKRKVAAGEDPAPSVFERIRDDAAAHRQFGYSRERLRGFVAQTCKAAGLTTIAEGMSFADEGNEAPANTTRGSA